MEILFWIGIVVFLGTIIFSGIDGFNIKELK